MCIRDSSIASIKSLYTYLQMTGEVSANPAKGVAAVKVEHKFPEILTGKEVELFLDQPQCVDAKGYRDHAMLELLYATGIRVSELISLNEEDVSLSASFIRAQSKGKERIIPLYPAAVKALSHYMKEVRPQLLADPEETALFVFFESSAHAAGTNFSTRRSISRNTSSSMFAISTQHCPMG